MGAAKLIALGSWLGHPIQAARVAERYVETMAQTPDLEPRNGAPFYVAHGECVACLAPEHEAPGLIGFDEEARSCFFRRQPDDEEELYQAVRAVHVSCCGAVRYRGGRREVAQRLERAGCGASVDGGHEKAVFDPPARVEFRSEIQTADELANVIVCGIQHWAPAMAVGAHPCSGGAEIACTWDEGRNSLRLALVRSAVYPDRWVVSVPPSPARVSLALGPEDALRGSVRAAEVRWFSSSGAETALPI